jgi:hypothetical protein
VAGRREGAMIEPNEIVERLDAPTVRLLGDA